MRFAITSTAPLSARISKTKGPKVTLMLGALVVAAGYGIGVTMMSAIWQLVLVSSIIGAGVGLAYGAMPSLVMGAVPVSETAAANSLNTLMRSIGTSVSSAVAGVTLAQMTTTFGSVALPSENAFRVVMAIGSAAALVAFGFAACLPRRSPLSGSPSTPVTGEPSTPADTSEGTSAGTSTGTSAGTSAGTTVETRP
ncbi:MFS transporter [Streptomyces mirabilis]|uniref:MFS transporter n=1 Tax=Streptomyces mirabilis TaxID=68239 RepID=UPI003D9E3253